MPEFPKKIPYTILHADWILPSTKKTDIMEIFLKDSKYVNRVYFVPFSNTIISRFYFLFIYEESKKIVLKNC